MTTPPTQLITPPIVTLRIGAAGVACVAGGVLPDRDAVANGDVVGPDEDVLDDEP